MPQVADQTKPKSGVFAYFLGIVNRGFEKKIDAIGLDLFRITYHIVLLCEIVTLFQLRHLVYDAIPFIYPSDMGISFMLITWMVIVCFLILGLFTKPMLIANYVMVLCMVASLHQMEYHMFYVYTGLGLLQIFMPMGHTLSLDNWIKRRFQGGLPLGWQKVGVIYYYIPLLFGIAFVYADSMFYKLESHNWMSGLGMWIPAVVLPAGIRDWYWLLDNEFLMKTLGYTTVIFEGVYLFLMFTKWARIPLMVIAMGLHLGIWLFFPIPWFGLGVCGLLLLMMPVGVWRKFIPASAENPNLTVAPLLSAPVRNRLTLTGCVVLALFQLNSTYQSFLGVRIRHYLHTDGIAEPTGFNKVNHQLRDFSTMVLGVTNHAVFMDFHFDQYNHVVTLRALNGPHAGEWVPIMKQDGTPGPYLCGFTWVNYTFRVNNGVVNYGMLANGLQRYSAFWMGENGMNPGYDSIRFEVMVKNVSSPKEFVKGMRQAMQARPWVSGGYVWWNRGRYFTNMKDIESIGELRD